MVKHDPCREPHCGGSILTDSDRRVCSLCSRVVREVVVPVDIAWSKNVQRRYDQLRLADLQSEAN